MLFTVWLSRMAALGTFLSPGCGADLFAEDVMHLLPGAFVAPGPEIPVDGATGREVVRDRCQWQPVRST